MAGLDLGDDGKCIPSRGKFFCEGTLCGFWFGSKTGSLRGEEGGSQSIKLSLGRILGIFLSVGATCHCSEYLFYHDHWMY